MSQAEQALLLAQRSQIERLQPNLKPSQYYWKLSGKTPSLLLVRRTIDNDDVLIYWDDRWFSRGLDFTQTNFHPRVIDNNGTIRFGSAAVKNVFLSTDREQMVGYTEIQVCWSPYDPDRLHLLLDSVNYSNTIILPRDDALQLITDFCAVLRAHLDDSATDSLEKLAQFEQACRELGADGC